MIVHAPCEAMRGYWCAQTVRTLLQVPNRLTASIDLEPSAIGALAALIVRAGAVGPFRFDFCFPPFSPQISSPIVLPANRQLAYLLPASFASFSEQRTKCTCTMKMKVADHRRLPYNNTIITKNKTNNTAMLK